MTDSKALTFDDLPLTDDMIINYLQAHPDFFLKHPDVLASLRLQRSENNVASLVQKQQQVLRERNHQLQEEITHLLSVASHNEQLFTLYSDLYLRLLDCQSAGELIDCLYQATTGLLNLKDCRLWLIEPANFQHHLLVEADCQGIMNNRLSESLFYFGRLQQSEQTRIFQGVFNGSVVLIKLSYHDKTLGFLAISSEDADHFDPQMDTLLLTQFSQLVAKLLSRHIDNLTS
jgi:hypothetical protein